MKDKTTFITLFLFIFILLGKYISELLACSISNIINTHIIVKHIIGFFVVFTTLISLENISSLNHCFIKACYIYIYFIIATKTTKNINILLIILLFLSYFIYLYKKRLKKNDKKNNNIINIINVYQKYIPYIFAFLSIIGFTIYIGEKKLDYENEFSWKTFILGNLECSNTKSYIIDKLNYFEKIKLAFLNYQDIQKFIKNYK